MVLGEHAERCHERAKIVRAFDAIGSQLGLFQGRHQHGNEQGNDSKNNQQLYEGKTRGATPPLRVDSHKM